jgi:hypothetical protein
MRSGRTAPMDDTDALVAFVEARLAEDLALIDACEAEVGADRTGEPYADGSGIAEQDDYPSYLWGSGEHELAFMARFHPRTLRADVASKRRIVAMWEDPRTADYVAEAFRRTVCWLAWPYRGHPDWRPEWAPEGVSTDG